MSFNSGVAIPAYPGPRVRPAGIQGAGQSPAAASTTPTPPGTGHTSGSITTTVTQTQLRVAGGVQIDATSDRMLCMDVAPSAASGVCHIAVSPDGVTYTTVLDPQAPNTVTAFGIIPVALYVPKGWYVKITLTNSALSAAAKFF